MHRLEKLIDRLGGTELLLVSLAISGVPALFSAML
jgi:hypothetical protein